MRDRESLGKCIPNDRGLHSASCNNINNGVGNNRLTDRKKKTLQNIL